MTIKFYGAVKTVNGEAKLIRGRAFSNNFDVQRTGTGKYTITLNQWLSDFPIISTSMISTSYDGAGSTIPPFSQVTSTSQETDSHSARTFVVTTYKEGGLASDESFSFMVVAGSDLVVETNPATKFVLKPRLIPNFGTQDQTILTTAIELTPPDPTEKKTFDVDGATRLLMISKIPISVTLGKTEQWDPSTSEWKEATDYTVAAFNFQPGSNSGNPWLSPPGFFPPGRPRATLNPPGTGVMTVPHQIIVTAIDPDGNILLSDPVIRLSKESPDGVVPKRLFFG